MKFDQREEKALVIWSKLSLNWLPSQKYNGDWQEVSICWICYNTALILTTD